jgi:hypothetical protein
MESPKACSRALPRVRCRRCSLTRGARAARAREDDASPSKIDAVSPNARPPERRRARPTLGRALTAATLWVALSPLRLFGSRSHRCDSLGRALTAAILWGALSPLRFFGALSPLRLSRSIVGSFRGAVTLVGKPARRGGYAPWQSSSALRLACRVTGADTTVDESFHCTVPIRAKG